jgi:signal transduction histidine kinase/CheY-like chemotaxis protein
MNKVTPESPIDDLAGTKTQTALLNAGALQSAMLHSANLSIIATDAEGIIQFFNVGAERMLGYTASEVVHKINPSDLYDLDELMARADTLSVEFATPIKPGFEALSFKASRGIEDIYELTYICKDRSRIPAVVSISALRDNVIGGKSDIIGYLLVGTTNSVRTRMEAELLNAKAVAEKASLAKSDFLLQLSHELRTPLNVILGFAELIETGVPPPAPSQKQSLDQILISGRYLLELMNEILDRALLESGKVTLSQEPVSLVEVILECRTMIEPQAKRRHISTKFPEFNVPRFIKADRTRVKQVLMNLLLNAIKYNRPGGAVTVAITVKPADFIRISVRDTGKGLTADQLSQLFQPFNRLGQEAGQEEGAGIGLVVAKQLVEAMGGTIGAYSTVGEGSVFWVELKTTSAPQLMFSDADRAAPTLPKVAAGTPQRKVLYVEDNPPNLELVRQLIARRPNLALLTATDGILGIESARANSPEVILMDINMPRMNGIEALRLLRADPSTAHIPIIALSANAMPQDIEKGLENGFFNYVTKPIRVAEFMETLDAALRFAQAASAHAPRTAN